VLANLRTASMLFVVTVVFIVTFTPGFLMSLEWLPWNITVFYLYSVTLVLDFVLETKSSKTSYRVIHMALKY